jgi:hypothetical protein
VIIGARTAGFGSTNTTFDFGFVGPVVIGDFVWRDTDSDGVQDAGEQGIAAVSVQLLRNGATVDVTNTGKVAGDEVAQLYISDPVASLSQPVRRLRGFQRVTLAPGEKTTVTFTLGRDDFGFYDNLGKFVVEPGQIDVYAGNSSKASLKKSFTVES